MEKHPIRKFFRLTLIYICIILGIFIIQFTSQTIFSRNFGQLHLILSESKKKENKYADSFQISYNGITFFSGKNNHVKLAVSDGAQLLVSFSGWEQRSEYAVVLHFTDGVSILWELTGKNQDTLSISAALPPDAISLAVPYKTAGTHSLTEIGDGKAVFSSKDEQMSLAAASVYKESIVLHQTNRTASYSPFEQKAQFAFSVTQAEADARISVFDAYIKQIRTNIVSSFHSAPDITESTAAAYIAEMAQNRKYQDAVSGIPASFKTGKNRTYFTAPALDNLVEMNKSFEMHNNNIAYKAARAVSRRDADIFELENLAEYLMRIGSADIEQILSIPNQIPDFVPTLKQAAGIIETYSSLVSALPQFAEKLQPYINTSLSVIENSCRFENGALQLFENHNQADIQLTIKTSAALTAYGRIAQREDAAAAGRLMIVSQLKKQPPDIYTAAELYAKFAARSNTFYPHEVILEKTAANCVRAWTIAQSVSMQHSGGNIVISAEFPVDGTHYMILNGIEPFSAIEIYNTRFRSDPRFESYNSSGYVYDRNSKTLFLKYRHKSRTEIVRLIYQEEKQPETKTAAEEAPDMQQEADINSAED
ncbi:MAG: hypothetical protein NC041_07400 [Bacteroides sp.]|nr:hypothetical protein [Prevotella sp.]MCM1407124.1 hypothetical protein [Treponema brennaborense]MCM1470276.1 hypothetical protein [Bacteroides sp.]